MALWHPSGSPLAAHWHPTGTPAASDGAATTASYIAHKRVAGCATHSPHRSIGTTELQGAAAETNPRVTVGGRRTMRGLGVGEGTRGEGGGGGRG